MLRRGVNNVQLLSDANVIKQGDTANGFEVQLLDKDGSPVNLTGSTVKWSMALMNGGKVLEKDAVVDDAAEGIVRLVIEEDDNTGSGEMRVEIRVDDGTGVQKFPAYNYLRLSISTTLDDVSQVPVSYATIGFFTEQIEGIRADSQNAKTTAEEAKQMSESTQEQLDTVVARETDSDAMSIQATVRDVEGRTVTFDTLKERNDDTDLKVANSQYSEGDLISLIHNYSSLKDKVIVKARDSSTIDVGIFYQDNKATIYTMKPDGDGWWRLFDVVNREMIPTEKSLGYLKSKNYESSTGTWSTSSPPHHYTTEVGATFTGSFEGSGFVFSHRIDDKGGVWEFMVDGYIKIQVSTWNSSYVYENQTEVVRGLANTKHTFVATFKGADPAHPPSGGTARGWANHYSGTGTTHKTVTPIIPSYENSNGKNVMQSDSRKEFAFSCKPDGSAFSSEWIPEHSVLGVMLINKERLFFGEREITDVSQEPNVYQSVPSVRFVTGFNAKHPDDPTILWVGRLDQTINGMGYHVRGRFHFQNDTWISLGYPAMLAIDKIATDNDRVVASDGKRYILPKSTNDNSNVVMGGDISSVAHFSSSSASQTALDTVVAMKIYDFKRTMRKGKGGRPGNPIVTRLRTDGNRKTYYGAYESYTESAGTVYDFGVTYFCGEIKDATEVLPG